MPIQMWMPRVDVMTVIRFERETGIGLFDALAEVLRSQVLSPEMSKAEASELGIRLISDLMKGKFENLVRAAYCACFEQAQERKLDFEAFAKQCDRGLIQSSLQAYMDFFHGAGHLPATTPKATSTQQVYAEMPGAGKTSTNSPEPQE